MNFDYGHFLAFWGLALNGLSLAHVEPERICVWQYGQEPVYYKKQKSKDQLPHENTHFSRDYQNALCLNQELSWAL